MKMTALSVNLLLVLVASFLLCNDSFKTPSNFLHASRKSIQPKHLKSTESDQAIEEPIEIPSPIEISPIEIPSSLNVNKTVIWKASVTSSVKVKETTRSVEDYMALPASEYSVLAAKQIERLSDTEFKCVIGNLNFFGTIICPVLYVSVVVFPEESRAEIVVTRAETTGSAIAESLNGTFSISAVNLVSSGIDKKGRKTLNSETNLVIDAVIPQSKVPFRLIQSGGNFIMQSSLNVIVPTFVRILALDFKRWSAGSDERKEVEGAELTV